MSDNIPRIDQEDLLRNAFGGFDSNYSSGYPQENSSVQQDESDILGDVNILGIPHIDPALLPLFDPSVYQNQLAQNDPRHFGHLAVSDPQPPRWQGSSVLGSVRAVHGVHHSFGAAQVEGSAQTWYGNASTNTWNLNLHQPDTCQNPLSVDEAGPECKRTYEMTLDRPPQNQSWLCNETDASQHPSGREPSLSDPHSRLCNTQMDIVQHQGQVLRAVMSNGDDASNSMYSFSNIDFHDPDLASAYSSAAPYGVAMPQPTAPPSKSVVCPFCKRQLQDRPGLRHHLDIHDPAKASRYKCGYGTCTYASRYPKDVVRHNLTHVKPEHYRFVCSEPGCDGKFHRKDYLLRHCRKIHLSLSEVDGARSSRRRALTQNKLTVPRQRRSRATSASSKTDSIHKGGVPSSGSRRAIQRTLRTPLRPSRPLLRLSSAGVSTNLTHEDSSFVFDNNSLLPTPQTATSSFVEYLNPRLLSPTSPSDSFSFSATGSPCPQ